MFLSSLIIVVILLKQYCILEAQQPRLGLVIHDHRGNIKLFFFKWCLKEMTEISYRKSQMCSNFGKKWRVHAWPPAPSHEGKKLATINKYFSCKVLIPTWCDAKLCVADGFTHAVGTKFLCFWRSAAVQEKNIFCQISVRCEGKVSGLLYSTVQHHSKAVQHTLKSNEYMCTHILTVCTAPLFGFPPPFGPSVWKPDLWKTWSYQERLWFCFVQTFTWWKSCVLYLDGLFRKFDFSGQLLSHVHVCILALSKLWSRT